MKLTLSFSCNGPSNQVSVRAAFFRICTDATLRAPDGDIVATFRSRRWRLGNRGCEEFTTGGPVVLRIKRNDGTTERLGPYDLVRAADGALFTRGRCLGIHSSTPGAPEGIDCWDEITILPHAVV